MLLHLEPIPRAGSSRCRSTLPSTTKPIHSITTRSTRLSGLIGRINSSHLLLRNLTRLPKILLRLNTPLRRTYIRLTTSVSPLKHITPFIFLAQLIGILDLGLVSYIYLLVMTLFINLHNMMLPLLHKHMSDVALVSKICTFFDLVSNLWILWENVLLEELFRKRICTDLIDGHVDKLRFLVEADIVVAYKGVFFEFDSKMVLLLLRKTLCHQIVSNADLTL